MYFSITENSVLYVFSESMREKLYDVCYHMFHSPHQIRKIFTDHSELTVNLHNKSILKHRLPLMDILVGPESCRYQCANVYMYDEFDKLSKEYQNEKLRGIFDEIGHLFEECNIPEDLCRISTRRILTTLANNKAKIVIPEKEPLPFEDILI